MTKFMAMCRGFLFIESSMNPQTVFYNAASSTWFCLAFAMTMAVEPLNSMLRFSQNLLRLLQNMGNGEIFISLPLKSDTYMAKSMCTPDHLTHMGFFTQIVVTNVKGQILLNVFV